MKACIKCGLVKPLDDFPKRAPEGTGKRRPRGDGHRGDCRPCFNALRKAWCDRNPGAHARYNKNWHARNPEYNQQYVILNADAVKEKKRAYATSNRHILSEISRRYSLSKRGAAPKWLTKSHRAEIAATYKLARSRSKETGVPHQVDHIVPLQGDGVCGLHVPWNLQVITASDNRAKSNRIIDALICEGT